MIRRLVDFALNEKLVVGVIALLLLAGGIFSFHNLPVEAYPDVANNWVQIITQWPGHAAEEVEQQVTMPVETGLSGIKGMTAKRSVSLFGLSVVTLVFDDESDNQANRQQALEKLSVLSLAPGISPTIGPDYSPVGQIYFYTITSTNPSVDLMEQKAIQDWDLEKQLKSVPGVAEISSFGGITREYQVRVDPMKLLSYNIGIAQVEQALAANNVSTGGGFIEHGEQVFNIRAVGQVRSVADIANTVVKVNGTTPLRIRDLAEVQQGPKVRLGKIGRAIHKENGTVIDADDVVEGYVLLRKGAEFDKTLQLVHEKVDWLNAQYLPKGVKISPFLDRSDLVAHTTRTVMHNLTEGILLVVLILFIFLGNVRSALIVSLTIPFSLLFASICLDLRHIPANLLSLGALDFGMVVDGCVVMVENILRHIQHPGNQERTIQQKISHAAHEVQRPVFYAIATIITAYLPIFTLQRVEGKLFRPMAWTVSFALLGALLFSLILAPVLASLLFRKQPKEWHNPVLIWLTKVYRKNLTWCIEHHWITISTSLLLLLGVIVLAGSGYVGSEFLPHLDEGAIWARGTMASSTGPSTAESLVRQSRIALAKFPEVKQVISQVGRPDDGTDATGFFNMEFFVDLLPREQWRQKFQTKEELITAMDSEIGKIPGVNWNFSQPIADNMEEAVSGVKGQLAIKLFGTDLKILEEKATQIELVMRKIAGVADLGIFRVVGQPNLNLIVNREKTDRFGINIADVQDAVETAIGGKAVTQVLAGERRYDLVVRYPEAYRRTPDDIGKIRILAPSGERVALSQLCDIRLEDGASMVYREGNSRYIAIKFGIRGRDLGSTVEEAMAKVAKNVELPRGYHTEWAGEFESQKRSQQRLALVVPVTILLIFMILYSAFRSLKWAGLIMLNVAMAPVGGILALYISRNNFSVSSGVGFLALFGVCVQTGVIMVEYINQLRCAGMGIEEAAIEGAALRLRPILMTMLVATLGLLPAAFSHDIGSDSQRPFAVVIVGGLLADLFISILLLPTLYVWMARPTDKLEHNA